MLFYRWKNFWILHEILSILVKILVFVKRCSFCRSFIFWKMNGVGFANSDLATHCVGSCFDVEGVLWLSHRVLTSSCVSVSVCLYCCSNCWCSNSRFCSDWFTASIVFWLENETNVSFSVWTCSKKKTSVNFCCSSKVEFCTCWVIIPKNERSGAGVCGGFCCVFSVDLYLVPQMSALEKIRSFSRFVFLYQHFRFQME